MHPFGAKATARAMWRWRGSAIAWGLALLCGVCGATPARGGEGGLLLATAWEMTLANNLTLQQQAAVLQQMQEELEIQRAGYLPTVTATGSWGYTSAVGRLALPFAPAGAAATEIETGTHNRYDLSVAVAQPVFTGRRTRNLVDMVHAQSRAQTLRQAAVRNRLLEQVGQLYYQIQLNGLHQAGFAQAIARTDRHLEKVRNFYLAAQTTAFDTLAVANRKLELQGQVHMLRHAREALISRLAHALNVDALPQPVPPLRVETIDLDLAPVSHCQRLAAENRPELRQMAHVLQAESYHVEALRSPLFPQIYASVAYHVGRPGVDVFHNQWMGYFVAGMTMRWQVWTWRQDRRRVRKARLEHRRLDLEAQQQALDIQQQVTEVYEQLQGLREQIAIQQALVRQEKERYRITQETYAQGHATSLDLSMAEHALTAAELTLQQRYAEWLQYRLQLNYVSGTLGQGLAGR